MKFAIQTLFAIGFTALALNASAGNGKWSQNNSVVSSDTEIVESTSIESISVEEEHGIIFMREEEKLARDVYTTLYDIWGMAIFNNIAKSEQSHMDAMKVLIDKYALADPNIDDSIGVYSDYHFTETFEELVALGSESLESALKVGIIIEELDIKDINEMASEVEGNDDIVSTYEELLKGSRNHLRAFWDVFSSKGLTYEPQFISQEAFDAIIFSSMETGNLK